jgi:putative ABC transport system substrate-binding protein
VDTGGPQERGSKGHANAGGGQKPPTVWLRVLAALLHKKISRMRSPAGGRDPPTERVVWLDFHSSTTCPKMDRRKFIGVTAGGLLATSVPATAQQAGGVRHVGILTAGVLPRIMPPALVDELRERGWVEGQNLVFDRRGGDGNSERVPALAAELVQMKVDVIVSFGAVAGVALRNATTTIPIVATTGDPVRLGLVSNLSHPGGNITGLSLIAPELAAKRLELIRELLPKATLIGELVDPANTYWQRVRQDYEQAFRAMRMQPLFVEVANPGDIEKAIAQIAGRRADALVVRGDPMFASSREQIGRLAMQYALPTIAEERRIAEAGMLMSYGPNVPATDRIIASYIDRILRGAKPGDLPIAQPTKFEFVINMKTAKALGLTIPQSLMLRADEVIQ